ncbi:MAG TPA: riboflavin synthase [Trueperaceae bacterium]
MFTGIVEEVGTIARAERRITEQRGGDLRVRITAEQITADLSLGDSVAVSGCCLTVVDIHDGGFEAELTQETLDKTAPRWRAGQRVNLERAMPANGRFGGHMVSGHVEGKGGVQAVERMPGATIITMRAPEALGRYLIPKGSITVDGVSLTVVDVGGPAGSRHDLNPNEFTLWLIPHTLAVTTLGELSPGDEVNLEPDLVAKYLERLMRMEREHDVITAGR